MAGFFFNFGRIFGEQSRKANWVYRSLAGNETQIRKAEHAIGRDLARAVLEETPADPDPCVDPWLTEVGAHLARGIESVKVPHTFQMRGLLLDEPNAFALPGGFIFVTRGLLKLCQVNPDEAAFVLAHEMAHVLKGHAMERIMTQSVIQTALSRWNPVQGLLAAPLKGLVGLLLQQHSSQEQELEADRLGLQIVRQVGFDPMGARRLFTRLADLSPDMSGLGRYFASHPPWRLRLQNLGI
jgi:predicted Zn-dependent protease